MNDEELFERWRTVHDHSAFSEIERQYRDEMCGYARARLLRLGVSDADGRAQDYTQETFLRLSMRTRPLPSVRNWLYCVLGNLATDAGRDQGRGPRVLSIHPPRREESPLADPEDDDLGPLEELINSESPAEIMKFWQCVQALSDEAWRLLVMRYVDGRGYEGIVRLAGLKYSQVSMRLHAARQQLRQCYRRRTRRDAPNEQRVGADS